MEGACVQIPNLIYTTPPPEVGGGWYCGGGSGGGDRYRRGRGRGGVDTYPWYIVTSIIMTHIHIQITLHPP